MNITKEIAEAILGDEDSYGLVIINLNCGTAMEVAVVAGAGMALETLRPLGEAAVDAIARASRGQQGCQCPKCQAARALSHNAPAAQA